MRLTGRFRLFYKILFVEAAILFLVGAIFYSQFGNARSDLIKQTVAASELIGEEATVYAVHTTTPTSSEFYAFLNTKHGSGGLFKTFEVPPSSFRVAFAREGRLQGRENSFYFEKGYAINDEGGMYSISVPFLAGEPYGGIVTIETPRSALVSKVLRDNLLLYLALFIVLNNQVFILHYLISKRQQNIIDKGYTKPYMKQHSIGALKVMRKILEEIIEDHPGEVKKNAPAADAGNPPAEEEPKKVISLSRFLNKN